MSAEIEKWRRYEETAQYLLNQFANYFGLGRVEGKQIIPGVSGTNWAIDAKGVKSDGAGIILVECKRRTTSKLSQEQMAGIAFRITDTGAQGGITVSPLELQKGAKLVAAHAKIVHVVLDPSSTTMDYLMKFLDQVFVGVSGATQPRGSLDIQVIKNGNVAETLQTD